MNIHEWAKEAEKMLSEVSGYNDHWGKCNYHRWPEDTEKEVKSLLATYPETDTVREKLELYEKVIDAIRILSSVADAEGWNTIARETRDILARAAELEGKG